MIVIAVMLIVHRLEIKEARDVQEAAWRPSRTHIESHKLTSKERAKGLIERASAEISKLDLNHPPRC